VGAISSPHFDVYYYRAAFHRVLDLAEKASIKLTRDMGHILSESAHPACRTAVSSRRT
jgi:hypothetical protein